jgi:hypothetical protein
MSIIKVDLVKFRAIAHDKRRAARAAEFAPYDEIIAKQIPGQDAQSAESERQRIRDKYSAIRSEIDSATTAEEINSALGLEAESIE